MEFGKNTENLPAYPGKGPPPEYDERPPPEYDQGVTSSVSPLGKVLLFLSWFVSKAQWSCIKIRDPPEYVQPIWVTDMDGNLIPIHPDDPWEVVDNRSDYPDSDYPDSDSDSD